MYFNNFTANLDAQINNNITFTNNLLTLYQNILYLAHTLKTAVKWLKKTSSGFIQAQL